MSAGRRPVTDHDMAQTLNCALGDLGGKQKSWMVPPSGLPSAEPTPSPLSVQVRRRGRPRKQPLPSPSNHPQPHTTDPNIDPQLERYPPSNSTSPQLANVVAPRGSASYDPSAITVLPSPTPSEENPNSAPIPTTRHGQTATSAPVDFPRVESPYANYAPGTPLETIFMDSVRRAGLNPKRPAEENAQLADKRSRVDNVGQIPQTRMAGTPGAPSPTVARLQYPEFPRRSSVQQSQNGSPVLEQMHSRSPSFGHPSNGQMPSPRLPQALQLREPWVGRTPPQPQTPFGPPRTLSRGTNRHPSSVAEEINRAHIIQTLPAQQAMASLASWYTLQECLQVLNSFQASYPVSENHPRDGRRLAVLKDATEKQDWPYLTMHQYYCMLSYDLNAVPAALRNQPTLNQALRVMHEVLDTNEILSPEVLRFFSNYPYPMEEIAAKWPSTFQHQGHLFLMFVAQAPNYDRLRLSCERRRCPPLPRELALDLRIASTTFQRLLFTAFLRSIWRVFPQNPQHARFELQAVTLFRQNQADYYQREALKNNVQPVDPQDAQREQQEKDYEWRVWGTQLQQLVAGFEATLRSEGSALAYHLPQQSQSPAYPQPQHLQIQGNPPRVSGPAEMSLRSTRPVDPQSAQAAIQQTRGRGRPRTRPAPASHNLPSQLATQQPRAPIQQSRPPVRLLPSPGWTQPQQRLPNPARFSLHQAHLRSPILQAQSAPSPLYHFIEGYINSPTRLTTANRAIEKWAFNLTPGEMQMIPQAVRGVPGGPDIMRVSEKSKTIRVRCIKWSSAEMPTDHAWAVADTAWVPYSCFTFNGKSLEQRKKVHNGKDLPIDITGLLRGDGNNLEIAVIAQSTDTSYLNYLVAIEVLGVQSHNSIKQNCLNNNRVSAAEVLEGIKKKLSGTSEDDEIAIVESNLTINLFDPFSASKICDIPVRSKACLHNDCFDLETFLQTRRRKGDTSVADQWRCPICNADARPQHLLVDDFLEDVRKQLEAQGLLQTRAILVQQDGSWKPKAEVRDPNGVSSRGGTDEPPTPTTAQPTIPAQMEVIDLSD